MRLNITSAAGVLALLNEPEHDIKVFALRKLNDIVDVFWAEISECVGVIEVLYEDETFKHRNLAALVLSKVYYHLGAFEDSLTYALGARDLFDVNHSSEYVETIISKCIDYYTKQMVANEESGEEDKKPIDPHLEAIVNRMFQRCFDEQQYKQAVGIALETRRIDVFREAITQSKQMGETLSYALKVCMSLLQHRQFRMTVLRVLVQLYLDLPKPDYISVCQCLIFLEDPQSVAEILEKLLQGEEESLLMAYQIGFDLYESATQQFLKKILDALRNTAPLPQPLDKPATEEKAEESATMDTDEGTSVDAPPETESKTSVAADPVLQERVTKLHHILAGNSTIALHLQFLIRTNKADLLILKNTKDAVRNSVCHNATVIANAFMHFGTTSDAFLRNNLDWLSRATNWAKFTATASLGVIHRGHEKDAMHLMSTYLPKETGPGSAYTEGGGLYALGMIHANHGADISEYLLGQLKEATTDIVRHGGCLGLGLAAMGTAREDVYEQLKFNLYQDDAVTGEAAGIAMGLVMLGTKSPRAIEDMVGYAQETQHEKILRGLAVGIALVMYGRLEEADPLIESLCRDKDPILRWSGMYTVAMAYCGTGNNRAIRKLLHVAVSDVNDDVRRAAVTSLGFILFRMPEQCPSVVSLLSESYNPHVRYGAAMALGIACAGTGLKEAMSLLEPMTNDPVNYVRQGALVASALILVQQNEVTCPKVKHFRELYSKVVADKHDDVMAKFGAILAQGIIDAGGRNCTIGLQSRSGHTNMQAVVGMLVFQQFWYWYPLTNFLCMAFTPSCIVLLNKDLQMPKLEVRSGARPSQFAYVPPLEEKKDKKGEKVETAVLSITAKAKKKQEKKEADKMDVEEEKKDGEKDSKPEDKKPEDKKADDKKTEEKKPEKEGEKKAEESKKKEAGFEMLSNPARVMRQQLRVLQLPAGRYNTVKEVCIGGIIMLKDSKPEEEHDIVEDIAAGGPKKEDEEAEPEPPEPFEWTED